MEPIANTAEQVAEQTVLLIPETISSMSAAILFFIVFISIFAYLIMSGASESAHYKQLKKAQRLIAEGHSKALKGDRHDGIFREIKREKYKEEYDKCLNRARNTADSDMSLLS